MSNTKAQGGEQAFAWRKHLKVHRAAEIFPLMRETDPAGFAALVEDIRTNGLQATPVFWHEEGTSDVHLIDGRNRLDALAELGILGTNGDRLVFVKEWVGNTWVDFGTLYSVTFLGTEVEGDPYAIALSLNVHRRHLTAEQKRELIAKLLKRQPEVSNNSISKQVNADDKTVASVRRDLEGRSEIPNVETRIDTKGRNQPAKRLGARHKCWQCGARAPVGEVKQHNYATYEDADVWLHDSCVAAFEAQETCGTGESIGTKGEAPDDAATGGEKRGQYYAETEEVTDVLDSDEQAAAYLEALGVDRFFRVLQDAPNLRAAIDRRMVVIDDGGKREPIFNAVLDEDEQADSREAMRFSGLLFLLCSTILRTTVSAVVAETRTTPKQIEALREAASFIVNVLAELDEEPPPSGSSGSEPKVKEPTDTVSEQVDHLLPQEEVQTAENVPTEQDQDQDQDTSASATVVAPEVPVADTVSPSRFPADGSLPDFMRVENRHQWCGGDAVDPPVSPVPLTPPAPAPTTPPPPSQPPTPAPTPVRARKSPMVHRNPLDGWRKVKGDADQVERRIDLFRALAGKGHQFSDAEWDEVDKARKHVAVVRAADRAASRSSTGQAEGARA